MRGNAAEIIARLGGDPKTGMCRCPAHDDDKPSLHVSNGRKGVVFYCHGGCSQSEVINALKECGAWQMTSTQNQREQQLTQKEEIEEQERKRYRRARGILYLAGHATPLVANYLNGRGVETVPPSALELPAKEAKRLFGKAFPAMVVPIIGSEGVQGAHVTFLSRDGGTKLNIDKPKRTIGKLRGGYVVLGELNPDKPLIVAEGVESALSASQITGFPAIAALAATNMSNVMPPACSEIIIAADNDNAGRKAAEETAKKLARPGKLVRIAIPQRDRADWNDALLDSQRNGIGLKQLRRSIVNAERFEGLYEVQALNAEAFMQLEFPPREYLIRPWLETDSVAMIHAPRGAGKTYFALSVAHAVSTGTPLMQWPVERAGRVLYVDGELPGSLLQSRLAMFPKHPDGLWLLTPDLFYKREEQMPDFGTEAGRSFLDALIERHKIDLIILDSLSTLVRSGVENEAESWVPIQSWTLKHRFRNRSIILVHHEGKSNKPRGSSKREDILDTMIGLKPHNGPLEDDNTSTFKLEFTKHRRFFGADAAPMIVHLSTASGAVEWRSEAAHARNEIRIAELIAKGRKQKDIAVELGISEGRVSQLVKKMNSNLHH